MTLLLGCVRAADPCPPGSSLRNDRCALEEPPPLATGTDGGDRATADLDAEPSGLEIDAGEGALEGGADDDSDVEVVAMPDAEPDVTADARTAPRLDASNADAGDGAESDADGQTDADFGPSPDADAGETRDDAGPQLCTSADIVRWEDFHLSAQMVVDIGVCLSSHPTCRAGSCPLVECLLQRLGIRSCDECLAQQVGCVAAACAEPCGTLPDNAACRACACVNGCVATFDACSGRPLNVCADCDGTTCTNQSRTAAVLIAMLTNQLLF